MSPSVLRGHTFIWSIPLWLRNVPNQEGGIKPPLFYIVLTFSSPHLNIVPICLYCSKIFFPKGAQRVKKLIVFGITVLVFALALTGCQSKDGTVQQPSRGSDEESLSGSITVAGSTSVQPLIEELAEAFMDKYPDVRIDVQGGGSSVGIQSAKDGITDIGASSRELKDSEKPYNLHEFVIAKDGIAVVVNPSNQIDSISSEQIKKIFAGEITNWKDLGGSDAGITVVSREEGSGTRGAFEEMVMKDTSAIDSAIIQPSTGAVKQTVTTDPDAIGYISMGSLDSAVKGLAVDSVQPTSDNVLNDSYRISRPFLMLTQDRPEGMVKAFLDFILSPEGQEIVGQEFIRVK
jgi:phosphate transport system substrate-binding protein